MNERVREKVEEIFRSAPRNKKIQDLKDELTGNLEEKYQDLLACGKSEEEALEITMASIGDMDELIRSLGEGEVKKKPTLEKQAPIALEKKKKQEVPTSIPPKMQNKEVEEKKAPVVTITLLACLCAFVFGVIPRLVGGNIRMTNNDIEINICDLDVVKEQLQDIKGIKKIETGLGNADVEVNFWDESELKVVESAKNHDKKDLFEMKRKGDTLEIRKQQEFICFLVGSYEQHKIQLYIPKSFKDDLVVGTSSGDICFMDEIHLEKLRVETVSGDVKSDYGINVEDFRHQMASGDCHYTTVLTKEYDIQGASGEIRIEQLEGKGDIQVASGAISIEKLTGKAKLESASGVMKLGSFEGEELKIGSNSGDIIVEEFSGKGEVQTAAGGIQIGVQKLSDDLKLEANSGHIECEKIGNVNAKFKVTTDSGDISGSSDIELEDNDHKATAKWGDGNAHEVKIQTASGSVSIDE